MILENRGIKYGAIVRILCRDKIISPQGGIRKKILAIRDRRQTHWMKRAFYNLEEGFM